MTSLIKRLNREELVMGGAFGAILTLVAGLSAWPAIPACSILWALGGTYNKAFRRFGVPAVVLVALWPPAPGNCVAAAIVCLALHVGYGVPSAQPPDPGSTLAQWLGRIVLARHLDWSVRMAYGALCGIGFWSLGLWWPPVALAVLFPIVEEFVP